MTVAVVFAIGLVVALGITHQIAQREAIMRGDEVDAAVGTTPARHKHIARSSQPAGQVPRLVWRCSQKLRWVSR